MEQQMYGVVLWTDARDSKAVIWCEDHGNLAFYTPPEQSVHQGVQIDAGDLIQFDMQENAEFRRASNLRRVDCGFAPALARNLRQSANTPGDGIESVVPFRRRA